ncbi:hypothetical protein COO60DRAFT_649497 [Scenedesmus sp. NREL 46B-D3]|nr:hypothetical protein COO60DRAFT_649497 [Scenedesmus sp. NREL 46B-D3]
MWQRQAAGCLHCCCHLPALSVLMLSGVYNIWSHSMCCSPFSNREQQQGTPTTRWLSGVMLLLLALHMSSVCLAAPS